MAISQCIHRLPLATLDTWSCSVMQPANERGSRCCESWNTDIQRRRAIQYRFLEAMPTTTGSNGETIAKLDNLLESHPKL